jgi:hypothetical protein
MDGFRCGCVREAGGGTPFGPADQCRDPVNEGESESESLAAPVTWKAYRQSAFAPVVQAPSDVRRRIALLV